ncbi:MAG: DUF3240 family protein [Azovibrio sp.]|nr:DUF3240 family protein [Azovibrio sp.]
MSDTPLLLTLIVPDSLAEAVADVLLAHPDLAAGFSSMPAAGHGSSIELVDAAELVSGHAERCRFDSVCADQAQAQAILALVRATFPGANCYYWLTPVQAHGRLA